MAIYTKKGDRGQTSNVLGNKYSKSDILMELQGGIDEINACTGHLRSLISHGALGNQEFERIDSFLKNIQYKLFILGVEISMEFTKSRVRLSDSDLLEKEIDYMTERMNPLRNFIYQSGSSAATYAHVVRSVVRRAERVFVRMLSGREYPESYQYINRLSDYFFTLARYLNYSSGKVEEILELKDK